MAKVTQGILGPASGKIGGVVAGSWKDVNYLRGYSKPANPNTASQQTQRGKFATCVNFAKLLIGQIFNIYTDRFLKSMSGFNYFISRNIESFASPVTYSTIKITEGKLSSPAIISGSTTRTAEALTIAFNANLGNNGANTDYVYGVAFNATTGIIGFPAAEVLRNANTLVIPILSTSTDDLNYWIFAIKRTANGVELISDSVYSDQWQ